MLREVYQIDENGYIIDKYIAQFDIDEKCISELKPNTVTKPIYTVNKGYYRPRWDRDKKIWLEDMSQEEIDELNKQPEKEPSELEILGQEITMLKLSNISKDNTINTLGQELTNIKLQLLQGGM